MKQYLLIESRDPVDHREVERMAEVAMGLADAGHQTTMFLIDNAVFAARPGVAPHLEALASRGVSIWLDERSLSERGMAGTPFAPGMEAIGVDVVVDALLAGTITLWR